MIIREWRGRVNRERAAQYPAHFRAHVVPKLHKVPGFLGAFLGERTEGNVVEYLVLTRWTSLSAVQAFAGQNAQKAVVEPGAIAALSDYDPEVRHYEVIETVSSD